MSLCLSFPLPGRLCVTHCSACMWCTLGPGQQADFVTLEHAPFCCEFKPISTMQLILHTTAYSNVVYVIYNETLQPESHVQAVLNTPPNRGRQQIRSITLYIIMKDYLSKNAKWQLLLLRMGSGQVDSNVEDILWRRCYIKAHKWQISCMGMVCRNSLQALGCFLPSYLNMTFFFCFYLIVLSSPLCNLIIMKIDTGKAIILINDFYLQ